MRPTQTAMQAVRPTGNGIPPASRRAPSPRGESAALLPQHVHEIEHRGGFAFAGQLDHVGLPRLLAFDQLVPPQELVDSLPIRLPAVGAGYRVKHQPLNGIKAIVSRFVRPR
jgi:hypothetical protein